MIQIYNYPLKKLKNKKVYALKVTKIDEISVAFCLTAFSQNICSVLSGLLQRALTNQGDRFTNSDCNTWWPLSVKKDHQSHL